MTRHQIRTASGHPPRALGWLLLVVWLASGCSDPAPGNRAPTLVTTPPATATTYQPYRYDAACADADGDPVSLTRGAEDTCGGTVTDTGGRTATYAFTPGPAAAGSTCVLALRCADPAGAEDGQQAEVTIGAPADLTDLVFGDLAPWDAPLADYIEAAEVTLGHPRFLHGLQDLQLWQDRLYFGYGDANVNIGRDVPIEIRAYDQPEPGAWRAELVTDEEQIDHYRIAGGRLVIPGVDATEDGLLGNAYTLDATGWAKRRTLQWGWHVHDVASVDGALYAVGSGGTIDDYNQSTVHAYLWRSAADAPFTVHTALEHPQPPGDHRLTRLLVVDGALHAFGYYSAGGTTYPIRYRLVGDTLQPWSELSDFFVIGTWPLGPGAGLVTGVTIGTNLTWGAQLVTASGVAPVVALAGDTVLDVATLDGNRALLLLAAGDTYPTPEDGPWEVTVAILGNDGALTPVLSQSFVTQPLSVAFWQRSLYVGLADGALWRSDGTLAPALPSP